MYDERDLGDNEPHFDNSFAPYEEWDRRTTVEDDMGWGFLFAAGCVIVCLFGFILAAVLSMVGVI